jgi:tRNA (cmo5U34)-methyltransferase
MEVDVSELGSDRRGTQIVWREEDSKLFIDLGRIYTPRRDEYRDAFLDLIPATAEDPFVGAELGTGAGWLTAAILERFPFARMFGLDGSETMLKSTEALLSPFAGRFDLRPFVLQSPDWIERLPNGLTCVVSSLVVHHLHGPEKAALFSALYAKLRPGGALLIADLVEPTSEQARRQMAKAWNDDVERQSVELTGDRKAFDQFVADRWNIYEFPVAEDDGDYPSTLPEQLQWLREAGFVGVDAFWIRAGHALFGGYRAG